jgi:hypothetical protein
VRLLVLTALTLGSCSSPGGLPGALMPDELTLGHGQMAGGLEGSYGGHSPILEYDGDFTSTSLALTWDLPTFKEQDDLDRETQRNMALLLDRMVAEEEAEEAAVLEEKQPPPTWLAAAFMGVLMLGTLFFWIKGKRSKAW